MFLLLIVLGTLTAAKAIDLFCQSWIANKRTHKIMLLNRQQEGCEFWLDGNLIGSSNPSCSAVYQGLCPSFWILPLNSGPYDEFLPWPPHTNSTNRITRKLNVYVSYGEHNEEYKRAQVEETTCQFCVVMWKISKKQKKWKKIYYTIKIRLKKKQILFC